MMKYFENESETQAVGDLTFENRLDRITLHGNVDLTLDKQGLEHAQTLKDSLTKIIAVMKAKEKQGALPDKITIAPAEEVSNPFA